MLKIDKFLKDNQRKLPGLAYCFGKDTNQDRIEQYEKAKLKILVVHMSTGETRSCSNTFTCISELFHIGGEPGDVFCDVCYLPEEPTREAFKKEGIPFMFGNVSHDPWTEYDVVAVSQAIMPEVLNFPLMYVNSGVPLSTEEREEQNCPLFIFGGASSQYGSAILGGEIEGHGHGLYDIGMVGAGEITLPELTKSLLEYQALYGIKTKRKGIIEWIMANCPVSEYFIVPKNYRFEFAEDNVTIKSIQRLDTEEFKKVKIARMTTPQFHGFNKKVFNVSGESSDSADVQVSSGCSANGCSFSVAEGTYVQIPEGLVRIENLLGYKGPIEGMGTTKSWKIQRVEDAKVVRVTLSDGQYIDVSDDHKWLIYNNGEFKEKCTYELALGDVVFRSLKVTQGVPPTMFDELDEDRALLVGFMQGDAYCATRGTEIQVFMKENEKKVLLPILEKEFGPRPLRVQHICKDGTKIECYDAYIGDTFIDYLGIRTTGDSHKVPECLYTARPSIIRAYLRGLFTADGWGSGSHIGLTSISQELLIGVQRLLALVGIPANLRCNTYYDKHKDGSHKVSYFLNVVTGDGKLRFMNEIGFFKEVNFRPSDKHSECYEIKEHKLLGKRLKSELGNKVDSRGSGQSRFFFSDRDGFSVNFLSLIKNTEYYKEVPELIRVAYENNLLPVTITDIDYTGEWSAMYDVTVYDKWHACCYNQILTHNCAEAIEAGHWTEKPLDQVEADVIETKKMAAPNTLSIFSFNSNYYKAYYDILGMFAEHGSNLSLINQRMDVIGAEPKYLELAKKMGLRRCSAAVEGMGDRVRNDILNKSLSRAQLMAGARQIFRHKLMMLKMG